MYKQRNKTNPALAAQKTEAAQEQIRTHLKEIDSFEDKMIKIDYLNPDQYNGSFKAITWAKEKLKPTLIAEFQTQIYEKYGVENNYDLVTQIQHKYQDEKNTTETEAIIHQVGYFFSMKEIETETKTSFKNLIEEFYLKEVKNAVDTITSKQEDADKKLDNIQKDWLSRTTRMPDFFFSTITKEDMKGISQKITEIILKHKELILSEK